MSFSDPPSVPFQALQSALGNAETAAAEITKALSESTNRGSEHHRKVAHPSPGQSTKKIRTS